jgi:ketosteroid isomerase-like protein
MTEPVDVSALAARLERLETADAARAALYRYAEGADTRDWALLGSAFAEDAVLEMPGSQVAGREAIVASLRDMLPDAFVTRHLLVNPQVSVDGPGRATVRATVYYLHEGSGYEATGWGDYRDDVTVVDGVGQITRKVFTPALHLPGSLGRLADRLERLETAEAAREASWRYAAAVDTLDFDLLAQVFTDDAVLTTRKGPRQGRDEIVAYYRQALADPIDRKHFMLNQRVTWQAPGEALMESYFIYTFAGEDTSILGWGGYHDRVRVIDGVGYLAEKRISIDVHADTRIGWGSEATP